MRWVQQAMLGGLLALGLGVTVIGDPAGQTADAPPAELKAYSETIPAPR